MFQILMFKGVKLMVLVFFKFDLEIVHLSPGKKNMAMHLFSRLSMFQASSLDIKGCGRYGPDKIWMKKKNLIKTIRLPLKGREKK